MTRVLVRSVTVLGGGGKGLAGGVPIHGWCRRRRVAPEFRVLKPPLAFRTPGALPPLFYESHAGLCRRPMRRPNEVSTSTVAEQRELLIAADLAAKTRTRDAQTSLHFGPASLRSVRALKTAA